MIHENARAGHEGGGSVRRFRTLMVAGFLSAAAAALAGEGEIVTLSLNDAGQVRPHHVTAKAVSYRGSEALDVSLTDEEGGGYACEAFHVRPINARAEDPPTVTLQVGGGSRFTLERPFETVLIGNPDMVDVQAQDERSVLLKPLSPGATNLVFIDKQGIVIINLTVFVREAGAI